MKMLYYTREALGEDIYAPKLADSLHLALITAENECIPLSHNQGLAFAKAVQTEIGDYHAYSMYAPKIVIDDNCWHILAKRIEVDGSEDNISSGRLLHLTTTDFIYYDEQELLPQSDVLAQKWSDERLADIPDGLVLPEGCIPFGITDIPDETALNLKHRFITPINIANKVPEQVTVSSPDELKSIKATAYYSDGSTVEKPVDWYTDNVDWSKLGRYTINGRVHQNRYEFPIALNKADPAICCYNNKYYFISTNDSDDNHTIFIREADSIPKLVTAQEICILDAKTYPHLGNLLWAPELHIINDRLYCFHAGTPHSYGEEHCHVMALKEGGNPVVASDWEMPRRVIRKDGSMLCGEEAITLDMTVFHAGGKLYTVWSQHFYRPTDLGAWLMIAELDPKQPWRLLTEPQVLCVPEYGWENNHIFVNEGPFALYRNGRIMLTYSGAFVDSSYVVGMLSIDENADPLDISNWKKECSPLLTSRCVEGEFGTGHNAYVTDENGLVFNTYHARAGINAPRSSGIRRVHFGINGHPWLDMTEEMDLVPELMWVKTEVEVN